MFIYYIRFGSRCLHRLSSLEQIQSPTRSDFTQQSLIFLMTSMNKKKLMLSKRGGIGSSAHVNFSFTVLNSLLLHYSQVFPNYLSAGHSICKHSILARIREKRLELRATTSNTIL